MVYGFSRRKYGPVLSGKSQYHGTCIYVDFSSSLHNRDLGRKELIPVFVYPPPRLQNDLSSGTVLFLGHRHFELSSTLDTQKQVQKG